MSHISNLRLLLSPLNHTLRFPFSSKHRPYSLLTILSSSSPYPKRRHRTTPNHPSLNFRSRSKTTSRETRDRDKGQSMDESGKENFGFNKKRAEGRDNPKRNLQLKVRKLNPINTISYVQVTLLALWGFLVSLRNLSKDKESLFQFHGYISV